MFKNLKKIIIDLTIIAMQKVKCLRSYSEFLKFVKVNNGKFLYFNNKICYIKIFCLMTFYECLLIVFTSV